MNWEFTMKRKKSNCTAETCLAELDQVRVEFKKSFRGYTHEFLSEMLGANRKSVTMAAQALQAAGLISYRRGKIQIVDRAGLEKASFECYAIVKERFDAFLTPPSTAVQGDTGQRKR
jgi:Crp-like helix-turn-helix domain